MARINDEKRKKIIVEGDSEALVEAAKDLGTALASEYRLTTSQIRGIFGTIRRIELDWHEPSINQREEADSVRRAKREFVLLQPRIEYQAKRERGRGVQALRDDILPLMTLVNQSKADPSDHHQRFRNFVDFFEAVLAYHRAAGGSN